MLYKERCVPTFQGDGSSLATCPQASDSLAVPLFSHL